jgi:hypothetical protein
MYDINYTHRRVRNVYTDVLIIAVNIPVPKHTFNYHSAVDMC